jgi:hypothetical protein
MAHLKRANDGLRVERQRPEVIPQERRLTGVNRFPIRKQIPFSSRIAFANTDLSGDSGHATAIEEGQRAAAQLLDRI